MNDVIKCDLYRYGGLTGTKGFLKGILIPGFRYTYLLRKIQVHKNHTIRRFIYSFFKRRYSFKYGFQIQTVTQIGKGFYIGHFGTVIIHPMAIIGSNCNISPGVTIGKANRGWTKGYPTIGDKVWIGTNSVIIGQIKIGSNVLIAPNSTVNFDVPDNSMVRGNPAKIVAMENATNDYINYFLE